MESSNSLAAAPARTGLPLTGKLGGALPQEAAAG